jgi:hypothetical protein
MRWPGLFTTAWLVLAACGSDGGGALGQTGDDFTTTDLVGEWTVQLMDTARCLAPGVTLPTIRLDLYCCDRDVFGGPRQVSPMSTWHTVPPAVSGHIGGLLDLQSNFLSSTLLTGEYGLEGACQFSAKIKSPLQLVGALADTIWFGHGPLLSSTPCVYRAVAKHD